MTKKDRTRSIPITEGERLFLKYLLLDKPKAIPAVARAFRLDANADSLSCLAIIDGFVSKLQGDAQDATEPR